MKSIIFLESGYTPNAKSGDYIKQTIKEINEVLLSKIDNLTYHGDTLQAWSEEELICSIPITSNPSWNSITDLPEEFPPTAHTHTVDEIIGMNENIEDELCDFLDELIEKLIE